MLVISCSNISIDFLQSTAVFTKFSVLYSHIPAGNNYIDCISRLWTIVDRQSGFQFLITIPDNFSAEQCTVTFDTYVVSTIGYTYYIVFDCDTLFMSSHFQSWAPSKGIELELSTMYHPHMDGPSQMVNKEIIQVARACNAKGNEQLRKILEIQVRLNLSYNASQRNNSFVTVLGLDAKLELDLFPHPIHIYQPTMEPYNATYQAWTNAKVSSAKQANLHGPSEHQNKVRDQVLLSTKKMNYQNVLPKMKSLWIGPFTILSANYYCNNYGLDFSSNPSLNLIYNTFLTSKIKPCVKNNIILFLQRQLAKPRAVFQNHYKVEKVMEIARLQELVFHNIRFIGCDIYLKIMHGSKPKTFPLEFYKTYGQKGSWKILSTDIIPTMGIQMNTKQMKYST